MKSQSPPFNIHFSKKGVPLVDGYYVVRNPGAQTVAVISIVQGVVSIHDVKSQMSLQNLINLDASGRWEIFGALKLIEPDKHNIKNKNDYE